MGSGDDFLSWGLPVGRVARIRIYALSTQSFYLVMLFGWAWSGAEGLRRSLREGAEEEYAFGYDFSRGHVSLEGRKASRAGQRRSFLRWLRWRQPRARDEAASQEMRRRVDVLLAKISSGGMASLTDEERRFLEEASRHWKLK